MLLWLLLSLTGTRVPYLPVVSVESFHVGQSWIWDYSDDQGNPLSSERYTLIEARGSELVFEMATEFPDKPGFQTHHRFTADLKKCLEAYRVSAQPKPWAIDLWNWSDDHWNQVGLTHPLAFEEKFNCNPHPGASTWQREVVLREDSKPRLFQHQKKTAPQLSWYALEGPQAGLAFAKDFVQRGRITYQFRLRSPTSSEPLMANGPEQNDNRSN